MDGEGAEDSGFVEVEMQVAPFSGAFYLLSSKISASSHEIILKIPFQCGMISSLADILKLSEHANAMVHPFGAMHHFWVLNGSR